MKFKCACPDTIRVFQFFPAFQSCQKVFKQRADNEQQAALELTPKAQVLEGRGIEEHIEIQSLRNGISRDFQEVSSTVDTMLFRQNTHNTGNNTIEMSQVFHDIARFEHFADLNLFKYAFNVIQNQNMDALQFYSMVLIFCQQLWQKEMKVANQPTVLAGYQPLLTALSIKKFCSCKSLLLFCEIWCSLVTVKEWPPFLLCLHNKS